MPNPLHAMAAVAVLALAACASSGPMIKDDAMTRNTAPAPVDLNMQPLKEWPIRFDSHSFTVVTYDTYGARVVYAGLLQRDDSPEVPRPPSASYGPDYTKNWSGSHAGIRNFPGPATVSWRSRDGQPHEAEIDFAEIFKEQVVRHDVAQRDVADTPDGRYIFEPAIILELNDRILRVYMQAFIPLRREMEIAGVIRSDLLDEPVLVRTYTY